MKEIIAVIRPKQMAATKAALETLQISGLTAMAVLGRGKQRGFAAELNIEVPPELSHSSNPEGLKYLEYIPKRLLSVVVQDDDVDAVVQAVIQVNQTGQIGDGRVFICPVENVWRVRNDDRGDRAV